MQPNRFLQLDEFKLQMREFIDVFIVLEVWRLWPSGCMPILFDRSSLLGVAPHRFSAVADLRFFNKAPSSAMTKIEELYQNMSGKQPENRVRCDWPA
jgi:hypothetical protein